jgi:hypothetical protein
MCMDDPPDDDGCVTAALCVELGEYAAGCAAPRCWGACSDACTVEECATRRKRARRFSGSSAGVNQMKSDVLLDLDRWMHVYMYTRICISQRVTYARCIHGQTERQTVSQTDRHVVYASSHALLEPLCIT